LRVLSFGVGNLLAPLSKATPLETLFTSDHLPFMRRDILFSDPSAHLSPHWRNAGAAINALICMAVLLFKTRDPFGASVALWWVGESFLDIAPYINDARQGSYHCWVAILAIQRLWFSRLAISVNRVRLLQYDHVLAKAAFAMGSAIMLLSLLWSGFLLVKRIRA